MSITDSKLAHLARVFELITRPEEAVSCFVTR
jgi:hypothetical protein